MTLATLDLDLDVFNGPFDLLLTLILREEVDLLEVDLADVVISYIDHLEARGELDLETATEFIVLIAALLELKSRLMLAGRGDEELLELDPSRPPTSCSSACSTPTATAGGRPPARAARAPSTACASARRRCRRTCAARSLAPLDGSYDPSVLGEAIGRLLRLPPRSACATSRLPRVTVAERLAHLRGLLRAGRFNFDEAVRDADRMTVAVTLFSLLELYKQGEADLVAAGEPSARSPCRAVRRRPSGGSRVSDGGRACARRSRRCCSSRPIR